MPIPTLDFDTLMEARDAIRARKVSSVELTRAALTRITAIEPKIWHSTKCIANEH